MSSKKEEKSDAAADRIKAAAMSAAKGLSRAQAERAAAAAARNVNAYGQKEEGPSRWQERKEAKRQMYLMSTEKAVRLGERKDLNKPNMSTIGGAVSQCQKCFQPGHWTYECKNERVYISRPSRSQILKNPKLRQKLMSSYNEDNPDIQGKAVEEEVREEKKEKKPKKKSKRKYKSDTKSSSDSEASDSGSDSRSSATGSDYSSDSASSYSSSSDSEEDKSRNKRKNNKKQKGRRKKYSSSSESSDYESSSDSDSGKNRRSKKKHSRRR